MGSAGGQFLHIALLTLLSSLHSLLQGRRMSALVISEGVIRGRVSERCEMRWKRVQRAKYKHRWNSRTHIHALAKTHTLKKMHKQGCYLNRQQKKKEKKPLTWQNKGGKKAYVTLQRGTDHIWVYTPTVEWQMIISVPCGSLERNLLKEWKWMWLSSEQSPDVSALTFSFYRKGIFPGSQLRSRSAAVRMMYMTVGYGKSHRSSWPKHHKSYWLESEI